MSELSFRLSDEFVSKYASRQVDWGYKDAGGNSLGEITFLRTYSRLKDDGTKERWHEVCRRVVEGMFSIQREWCKNAKLPWNGNKAQRSAQEAYDRMFNFKWTPPGRGLWMMGTPLVNEQRNSAALQNCFTGDTEFITRDGVRTLEAAVGEEVEVWVDGKGWKTAVVKQFGYQPIRRIRFAPAIPTSRGHGYRAARSTHRVDVCATPDHRWILADGRETTDLRTGDIVDAACANDTKHDEINLDWWVRGFIYGDGGYGSHIRSDGTRPIGARLCGRKNEFADNFIAAGWTEAKAFSNGDRHFITRTDELSEWKQLPDLPSATAAYSFIKGWLDADGSQWDGTGSVVLGTQAVDAYDWLKRWAAFGGFIVVGHKAYTDETNFGPRSNPLHKITLTRSPRRFWKVESIQNVGTADVYCAVVPEAGEFTLASGIRTGNCAFVSTSEMTKLDPSKPFRFLMEASMLGVGVGFDSKGADKELKIHEPIYSGETFLIPDSREGWVQATATVIDGFIKRSPIPDFDYSEIRPAGAPIKTFGGTAAGPGPLRRLITKLTDIFTERVGDTVDSRLIGDIGNLIGVCVVSGNVRRSAELYLGSIEDKDFLNLKNSDQFPERNRYSDNEDDSGWGWMSNNSVAVEVGQDLSSVIDGIVRNGEPGVVWMDVSRQYGRLEDPRNDKDYRVSGYNPCAEQSLESMECCTLVETYLNRHESLEDYKRTLKYAYLYAKTVTLLPTHWQETNAIMQRNRRIGTSMSGIANFADNNGIPELKKWMNTGYETIQSYDTVYSEWLGIRESIKNTTVKPSGTVSILAGESPGAHWAPGGEYFDRAMRFSNDDPIVTLARVSGYRVEPASENPETTSVVFFPVHSLAHRSENEVTIFEKANLAALAQRYWSDNSVSVTVSFNMSTEANHVGTVMHMYEGQLKTISFLPQGNKVYQQMPYTSINEEDYRAASMRLFKMDLEPIYQGGALDAAGEAYCTTDVCELKPLTK